MLITEATNALTQLGYKQVTTQQGNIYNYYCFKGSNLTVTLEEALDYGLSGKVNQIRIQGKFSYSPALVTFMYKSRLSGWQPVDTTKTFMMDNTLHPMYGLSALKEVLSGLQSFR
jgi:hypothetical protein